MAIALTIALFAATARITKLDLDNDGRVNAATDGLLIMRYLLGVRSCALIAGIAFPSTAERQNAVAIIGYIDTILASLDVDGVGGARATTDGILILRAMPGLSGTALIEGNLNSMRP